MFIYSIAILCVLAIAIGQLLFKAGAAALVESGSVFALKPALLLIVAIGWYGLTTLAWIWVLQKAELGRVYPLMAMAFVLVPLGSYFVFGERFHTQYFVGIAMIMAGIIITLRG